MTESTYAARQAQADETEDIDRTEVRSYWTLARQRFFRHRLAVFGGITLVVLIVSSLVIPFIAADTLGVSASRSFDPPEIVNADGELTLALLGYTRVGNNLFGQLMAATGTSLMIAFAAVLIIVIIGIAVGSVAGFAGGWLDNVLMRVVDIALAMPGLFIIIAFVAFWGASVWTVILAIGITGWTLAARLVRAAWT